MPFTPSHAVVALPFVGSRIPLAAVAIGAMTPDLPLFFPWAPEYGHLHGWPGLLTTALPLALLLVIVWRVILRPAAGDLLPLRVAERLPADWTPSAADGWFSLWGGRGARAGERVLAAVLLAAATLLGVITHVVWDLFTHSGRWGAAVLPALEQHWGPLPGYDWLQWASSALGLLVLAIAGLLALRRAEIRPVERMLAPALRVAVWLSIPLLLALSAAAHVVRFGLPADYAGMRFLLVGSGTDAGAAILVVLGLVAVLVVALAARRRLATDREA